VPASVADEQRTPQPRHHPHHHHHVRATAPSSSPPSASRSPRMSGVVDLRRSPSPRRGGSSTSWTAASPRTMAEYRSHHTRQSPRFYEQKPHQPRRLLVPSREVSAEGVLALPYGMHTIGTATSEHLTTRLGIEPMGYTPALGGRQFHRKRWDTEERQPVGGRHQMRFLRDHYDQRIVPTRNSLNHHFSFNGGTPRAIPPPDPNAQRLRSVDGYFTELDMHAKAGPPRPPVAVSLERAEHDAHLIC
jgi:hypothetical protein